MRRFRSVSDYLSLGAGPPDRKAAPLLGARVAQGPRPFEQRDLVVANALTIQHLRDAAAEMHANGNQPVPADPAKHDGFGPYYTASVPLADARLLMATEEFADAEARGEFRDTGKRDGLAHRVILVRWNPET